MAADVPVIDFPEEEDAMMCAVMASTAAATAVTT